MKKIIFSLIVCCLFSVAVRTFAQGWFPLNSGVTGNLNCVFFPASASGNFGYVSGDNGILLKTINGGLNWFSVSPNQYVNFKTIHFLDIQTGWASGWGNDSVFVYRTTNAGTNWTQQFAGNDAYNEPRCSFFRNLNCGYIGGAKRNSFSRGIASGFDMLTTNGGLNWSKANSNEAILSVYFPTVDSGWRGSFYNSSNYTNGELQWTTNGGNNWDMTQHWDGVYFYGMNFCGVLTGYAIGYDFESNPVMTIIHKTTNCGYSWGFNVIITSHKFYSVYFITPDKGWICGSGGIMFITIDGTYSWLGQTTGVTVDLKSITFTDINTGYAVGNNGVIIKTISGGWLGINNESEIIKDFALEQNYPNPFNPVTTIKFNLPRSLSRFNRERGVGGMTTLKVFDITGKEIATLVNKTLQPGTYEVTFDGSNLPSGIYFYQLRSGEYIETRKMLLIK